MRRIFGLIAGALLAYSAAGIGPGDIAPDFSCPDIFGKVHKLSDYKGKIVVLEAFNYDCPFCANHYNTGAMQELQENYAKKGVIWLLINSVNPKHPNYRTPDQAQDEWKRLKIKATAWLHDADGKVGKAYDLRTTPHMVVIGKDGKIVYWGAIDNRPSTSGDPRTARNYVKEVLDALLADKEPPVRVTKPYGCSVKYSE